MVLGRRLKSHINFVYGTFTPYGRLFQYRSTINMVSYSFDTLPHVTTDPATPVSQRRQAISRYWFRLFRVRSPLLTESLLVFFSSGYLDVSVHRVPSTYPMCSGTGDAHRASGFPIRISTGQRLLASHRGVSPLAASFIGILSLGIHHTPFVAYNLLLPQGVLSIFTTWY